MSKTTFGWQGVLGQCYNSQVTTIQSADVEARSLVGSFCVHMVNLLCWLGAESEEQI